MSNDFLELVGLLNHCRCTTCSGLGYTYTITLKRKDRDLCTHCNGSGLNIKCEMLKNELKSGLKRIIE